MHGKQLLALAMHQLINLMHADKQLLSIFVRGTEVTQPKQNKATDCSAFWATSRLPVHCMRQQC